jgi:type I restriction enzyme, S subunit
VSEWRRAPLSEVSSVFNGKTPPKSEQRDRGHAVLKIKDVSELGRFRGTFGSFVDPAFARRFAAATIQTGDTLILNAAHNAAYVASKTYRAEEPTAGALATGEWLIIRADRSVLDPAFAHHWVNARGTRRALSSLVKGIHLYPKDVEQLAIPLPPLPEQRRIADILDRADALRAKRQDAMERLNSAAQSVFLELFGDPTANDSGWPLAKIGDLATDHRGGANLAPSDFVDRGYPILHKGALKPGGIVVLDTHKKTFTRDEFAMARPRSRVDRTFVAVTLRDLVPTGPTIGLAVNLINGPFDRYLLAQGVVAFHLNEKRVAADYFVQLSNMPTFRQRLRQLWVGSTQIHIRNPIYFEIAIPLPPVELQREFALRIESIERLKLVHRASLDQLDGLVASLQHRAFRGEL